MTAHRLLTERLRAQLPPLDATQATPIAERLAVVKLYTPDSHWTWYVVEFDGDDVFYGLVDGIDREYGYFSLSEIESIRGPLGLPMERDAYFKPTALGNLDPSLKVDAAEKGSGGARNATEKASGQPSHPIPRITLTHRGII